MNNLKVFITASILWTIFSLTALAQAPVGYYVGSFDPPTLGHLEAILKAKEEFGMSKVYITVNYNTAKDYNCSVSERIKMLETMLEEQEGDFEVVRQPAEGRVEFVKHIQKIHGEKVLGIFGEDTLGKNIDIHGEIPGFEYIEVKRPVVFTADEVVIHPIEINADGVSSSKARELIATGKSTQGILDYRVRALIDRYHFYKYILSEENVKFQKNKIKEAIQFLVKSKEKWNINRQDLNDLSIKKTQSKQAIVDKIIRNIISPMNLKPKDEIAFTQELESILHSDHNTQPLGTPKKAGFFLGSFEPLHPGQQELLYSFIKKTKIKKIYLGVLHESPRKKLKTNSKKRVKELESWIESLGLREKIDIEVFAFDYKDLETQTKNLASKHTQGITALFGNNVFEANYKKLKHLPNVDFAVDSLTGLTDYDVNRVRGLSSCLKSF